MNEPSDAAYEQVAFAGAVSGAKLVSSPGVFRCHGGESLRAYTVMYQPELGFRRDPVFDGLYIIGARNGYYGVAEKTADLFGQDAHVFFDGVHAVMENKTMRGEYLDRHPREKSRDPSEYPRLRRMAVDYVKIILYQ